MSDYQAQRKQIDEHYRALALDIDAAGAAGADSVGIVEARRHLTKAWVQLVTAIQKGPNYAAK